MEFDDIIREVISDERTEYVPIAYIVHILMVAHNHGLLKEIENVSE